MICIEKLNTIQALEKAGYIGHEEAIIEAREAFAQLKNVSKDKRLLGILGKTSGRNLINGLGLLSWDECQVNIDSITKVLTSPLRKK
jgi:hypothetical protein